MNIENVHPAILIGGALFVILNLGVTWALVRDDGATILQKLFQTIVIWVVPFLGGAFILALVASHHTRAEMKSMVPFPFYLAAVNRPGTGTAEKSTMAADYPAEGGGGEGVCGGE